MKAVIASSSERFVLWMNNKWDVSANPCLRFSGADASHRDLRTYLSLHGAASPFRIASDSGYAFRGPSDIAQAQPQNPSASEAWREPSGRRRSVRNQAWRVTALRRGTIRTMHRTALREPSCSVHQNCTVRARDVHSRYDVHAHNLPCFFQIIDGR